VEWAGCSIDGVAPAQLQRPPLSAAIEKANELSGLAFAEEDYTGSYNVIAGLLKVNPAMDPARYPRQQIAVRSATHKYVWLDNGPGELYDMVSDSSETVNLIASEKQADQAARSELMGALESWRANMEAFAPELASQAGADDAAVAERLHALGYLA
jgi:hypothetical protein